MSTIETIKSPVREFSQQEIARRKAIAFLKGFIIGYSVIHGMKWNSTKTPTPEFQAGQKFGIQHPSLINAVHIIYNRIRHNRPHFASVEIDNFVLTTSESYYGAYMRELYFVIGVTKETKETLYAN